jgi:excisionase family DNA binding protein
MSEAASKLVQFKEVAEYFDVSVQTVRNWVKDRKIPFVKLGSVYRFNITEIEKAITTSSNFPGSSINEQKPDDVLEEEDSEEWIEETIHRVTLCIRLLWTKRPDLREQVIALIKTRNLRTRVAIHLMTGIPLRLNIDEIALVFEIELKEMRVIMANQKVLMHPINFPLELAQAWSEELEKLDLKNE